MPHRMPPADADPSTTPVADIVAGAVFDFAGFLATKSSPTDISELLGHVRTWAERRGLPLHAAAVMDWEDRLKHYVPPAMYT